MKVPAEPRPLAPSRSRSVLVFQVVVALHVLVIAAAAAEAAVVFRTPALDSAVVRSDREGGNFAYSTVEGSVFANLSISAFTRSFVLVLKFV